MNFKSLFLALATLVGTLAGQAEMVYIGSGNGTSEMLPIINWWLNAYQGNEVIYLKHELGMQPGDTIKALTYLCVSGSAYGGNFNVRLKNTTLTQLVDGTESPVDPSVLKVSYTDPVYGNVQLGPYSGGQWVTFELSEPFVYTGDNIIVDIRNTKPGTCAGWCYFATSICEPYRSLPWSNALDEQVTGFDSAYPNGYYIDSNPLYGDIPNVRISYQPCSSSTKPHRADVNGDGTIDIADVFIVINAMLGKE